MLRRRILASAMASVMAIGSVAVVASAEETAASTTQVKTKADLEAYVKSFDGFRDDGINDYGSISGEKFIDAIEFAENVLAADDSTVDDYTVAYAMVEATYNKLKIYTVEELKALLGANKKNYESGNVYNEELGDPIFEETGFGKFEEKYEDAESVLDSSDSRIITDAYEELDDAVKNLSRYDVVTKSQFRTALKEYETMLQKEFAYDSWRVGTMTGDWIDLKNGGYWGYQNQSIAYGALYAHVASINQTVNEAYEQMDEIKSLKQTSLVEIVKAYKAALDAVAVMNAWVPDDTNRASKANVQKLLNEYHSRLVFDYATSDANALFDAVRAFNGGDMKVLITINHGQASEWLDLNKAEDLARFNAYYDEVYDRTTGDTNHGWNKFDAPYKADADLDGAGKTYYKHVEAGINVKTGVQFYIPLDEDGKYWRSTGVDADGNKIFAPLSATKPDGKYKLITKNVDVNLADYIEVTGSMLPNGSVFADQNTIIDGDAGQEFGDWYSGEGIGRYGQIYYSNRVINSDNTNAILRTNLKDALILAENYLNGVVDSFIYTIDTKDSIADNTANRSSAEWTLVYRYLRYALHDKYDTSYDLYTKKDVEKLIEDCYELAELTGDAALFNVNHNFLVSARQIALDWVKEANKDKKYKDNVSSPNGSTSTDMYKFLNGYYKNLKNDYDAFKYSFEEIYIAIADTKSAIDDGDLEATDALLAALEDVSYKLSVVKPFSELPSQLDNDGFTTDRYFQEFNRVYTRDKDKDYTIYMTTTTSDTGRVTAFDSRYVPKPKDNGIVMTHYELRTAYEALLAEVKKQTEVTAVLGDVNGDGVVNALDAAEILKAVVNNTVIDVAVGDYNADGTVNALDASAILKFVVGLA